MKLTRKTIIENIYRINYDKIQDKDNRMNWIETLNYLAVMNYNELLENYISELKHNNINLKQIK